MKRSTDYILTTHTGSLPRPDDLAQLMFAREDGLPAPGLDERIVTSVAEIVRRQGEMGLDGINDGEMSKPSYATYVKDRLTGFGGESPPYRDIYAEDFPEWAAKRPAARRSHCDACRGCRRGADATFGQVCWIPPPP